VSGVLVGLRKVTWQLFLKENAAYALLYLAGIQPAYLQIEMSAWLCLALALSGDLPTISKNPYDHFIAQMFLGQDS